MQHPAATTKWRPRQVRNTLQIVQVPLIRRVPWVSVESPAGFPVEYQVKYTENSREAPRDTSFLSVGFRGIAQDCHGIRRLLAGTRRITRVDI